MSEHIQALAIVGGLVGSVLAPLVGVLCWFFRRHAQQFDRLISAVERAHEQTIPNLLATFRADSQAQRLDCQQEHERTREELAMQIERLRETLVTPGRAAT